MYTYGSTDCQLGHADPTHECGRDCSREHSQSKRSGSLKISFKSRPKSRTPSLSPPDSVETRLLPLSALTSNTRILMANNDIKELEDSGQSWGSHTTASTYRPISVNSDHDYHGFVGDEDPTFSIVSRVSGELLFFIL